MAIQNQPQYMRVRGTNEIYAIIDGVAHYVDSNYANAHGEVYSQTKDVSRSVLNQYQIDTPMAAISPTTVKIPGSGGVVIPDGVVDSSLGGSTIGGISTNASTPTLIPQLTPGTPEYETAMDNLNTSYYDILQQQMDAQNEQEKYVADYNWKKFQDYTEKNLNVKLSGDALQAWDQIQGLNSQGAQRNIEGSGIDQEAIDQYLRRVRTTDAYQRTDAKNQTESEQQKYYTTYASSQQIKDFALANPALASQWGLVPSDGASLASRIAGMKVKYPNMSDAEISQNIATMYDENGNYRSSLMQKYMVGSKDSTTVNFGTVGDTLYNHDIYGNPTTAKVIPVTPSDTGVLDIRQAKRDYQIRNAPLNNPAAVSGTSPIINNAPAGVKTPGITIPSGMGTGTTTPTTPGSSTPGAGSDPNKFVSLPGGATAQGTNAAGKKYYTGTQGETYTMNEYDVGVPGKYRYDYTRTVK